MKNMVTGDIHMEFGQFNSFLNRKRPEITFCCGDFGYWPREVWKSKKYTANGVQRIKIKPLQPKVPEGCLVFWCDGNHEDHQELRLRKTDELWPGVHYMPRGSVLEIPDGRKVMFMGGAESVDKASRTIGIDWFPDEVISHADVMGLDYEGDVDIVVSHTCPREFDLEMVDKHEMYIRDCSRMALSYVLHKYMPKLWYFGHWHIHKKGNYKGCEWTAMSCMQNIGRGRWWEWMS